MDLGKIEEKVKEKLGKGKEKVSKKGISIKRLEELVEGLDKSGRIVMEKMVEICIELVIRKDNNKVELYDGKKILGEVLAEIGIDKGEIKGIYELAKEIYKN